MRLRWLLVSVAWEIDHSYYGKMAVIVDSFRAEDISKVKIFNQSPHLEVFCEHGSFIIRLGIMINGKPSISTCYLVNAPQLSCRRHVCPPIRCLKGRFALDSGFSLNCFVERETGLEPATACLEGRNSTRLSYSRLPFKYTELRGLSLRLRGGLTTEVTEDTERGEGIGLPSP